MPQPRKLDETTLLALDTAGLTAVAMQQRLADEGTSVSLDLIAVLRDDLQGVLGGWGDSFAGSERYERFQAAVESLESVDVSWG